MYTIIYFSPTGNTKHLARELGTKLSLEGSKVIELDTIKSYDLEKDEHLIFMTPIHGFNAPRTVKRFVKNMPAGLYKRISIITVGCNTIWVNDAVSLELKKKFIKKGYEIVVDKVLAMPLTFIMNFPEETKVKMIEESTTEISSIANEIMQNQQSNKKVKMKSKMITFMGKAEDPAARLFGLELHGTKACTSCGICWNNCPENNIKKGAKGKPKFGLSCMMCMKCIYKCPEDAITPYISKFIPIKGGYSINNK